MKTITLNDDETLMLISILTTVKLSRPTALSTQQRNALETVNDIIKKLEAK